MNVPYTITPQSISLLVGNKMRIVHSTHANFEALRDTLRKTLHDVEAIKDLVDISNFVSKMTLGAVTISDDQVRWNGKPVVNVIADRLLDLLRAKEDLAPLAKFLDKLLNNPVQSSIDELYLWLEAGKMPITPDGNFIAFKKVRDDYKDVHSGTISYAIGEAPSMERSEVDTNRHNTCSRGLHFCSYDYLEKFGGERIVIVEIDPADVVSIPSDYNNTKGRTWRMKVIGEVDTKDAEEYFRNKNVYTPPAAPAAPVAAPDVAEIAIATLVSANFVVGALVVCVDNIGNENSLTVDRVYKVSEDTDIDLEIEIRGDDEVYIFAAASKFKPFVSGNVAFVVGDVVKCIANIGTYGAALTVGSVYTVTEAEDDEIEVTDDDSDETWEVAKAFELAPAAANVGPVIVASAIVIATPPAPVAPPAALTFTSRNSLTFTAWEVKELLVEHGQRGASRLTGIPRTTLQEWAKAITDKADIDAVEAAREMRNAFRS